MIQNMCFLKKTSIWLQPTSDAIIFKPIFKIHVPDTLVLSRINKESLTTLALWEFARGNLDWLDVAEI